MGVHRRNLKQINGELHFRIGLCGDNIEWFIP